MIKGFIFDMDGVIVDTVKYHYLTWQKLANELGFEFTKEQNESFKGVSRKRCLEILLTIGGKKATQQEFDSWMKDKNEDYLAYIKKMDASEILPDVPKILQFLKEKNIPIAVGSASKNAHAILKNVGLLHYFNVVVDGNDVVNGKPNPEIFLLAAKKIGVTPSDCVVFEDAVAGVLAANRAKMISIGMGDKKILSKAKYNFVDFTEVSTKFINDLIEN